jgi:glycosyltransferase involved in cell wall biosynthesis
MNERLMIHIPAYNAEKTIVSVLDRIPEEIKLKAAEIVVFDNHSEDKTSEVVMEYKKKNNLSKLSVIRHPRNLFFGGNIKAGCNYAIKNNMDIMAVLHSDGQYPPERIADLIRPIEEGKVQAVSGSRFLLDPLKGRMPLWRYMGNIFLTQLENLFVGRRFSEWHSGFRAYDCNTLKKLPFNRCVNGYEWTTDILLLLIANRFKIAEIPIPTHYGKESTSPSIKRTLIYFILSFKLTLLYFLHKVKLIKIRKYVPVKLLSKVSKSSDLGERKTEEI